MSSHFNFNHLYYFMMIAKEGSVTKASQKLFITQPTLSTQLKQFEDMLGYKVFDRKNKRLHLNKKGEIVLHYASQIFKLKDEMITNLKQNTKQTNLIHEINIGVLPSLSKSHVFEFIKEVWGKKRTEIKVVEGNLPSLTKILLSGKLDIILSDSVMVENRDVLDSQKVTSREIVAVAHPKYKKHKAKFPQSLSQIPFFNVTQHSQFRKDIDTYLYSANIKPTIIGEADDASILRLAAESGHCFVILPKNVVLESIKNKKLVILGTLKNVHSDMWAITRSQSIIDPLIPNIIQSFTQKP